MYSNRDFNRWRRHPWHGLHIQSDEAAADIFQVYIEMTPDDVVKYELDKASGFLMVDRPSAQPPAPPLSMVSCHAPTAPRKWPSAAPTPT